MKKEEILEHLQLKRKFDNYPKLPRFISTRKSKNSFKGDKGYKDSVLRGFYKRLKNWENQNLKEQNKEKAEDLLLLSK
jgi:hypothetical protein